MPQISKPFVASLLCGLLVTGCGGSVSGGTGTATSDAAITFPLSKALANLYAGGFQKTLTVSGTASSISNGTNYTFTAPLTVAQGPANAGATFGNQAARQIDVSLAGTFNINNSNGTFSSNTQNFLSASNLLLGTSSSVSNCVANTPGQYPDTITVGQTQLVVTYACSNASNNTPIGTGKISFIVRATNLPGTALFSTLETFLDTSGKQILYTEKDYLIDTSGNISFQSLSFTGSLTSTSGASTPSDIQFNFKSQ